MSSKRVIDPMERISETLFDLIMALTFTCTLGVATADSIKVQTMLFGAIGCNLAWGVHRRGVLRSREAVFLWQVADLGLGQGAYGSSTIYAGNRHRRLLRRSAKSVAAWIEREHH